MLSASVTFLSLPGLDNIARVVGFAAILLASFSMASTLVAIFRYKSDLERTTGAYVGGEGLMIISASSSSSLLRTYSDVFLQRRSVVMSLPIVFLAYAIIAFVAGITLYSFRGVTVTDKALVEHQFQEYTRWTVVGVLGGLAGILTTAFLLSHR